MTTANVLQSSARDMTSHVVAVLKSTESAVKDASYAAAETRLAIERVMHEFHALVEGFTGLDQRLGAAWKGLEESVGNSLAEFRRFEGDLNREFARSLGELLEAIDQMEPFTPLSSGPDTGGRSPVLRPRRRN